MADALSAHERALETGGLDGIPNLGLVESAIARPYNGHYRAIEKKAAALVESMSTNHGFADGNKRTTIILTHLLLKKSGYELVPIDTDIDLNHAVEKLVLSIVRHEIEFDAIVEWFKSRLQKMDN